MREKKINKLSTREKNGWRAVGHFLTKLSILLPCDTATAILGIYPNEPKMPIYTKTCMRIFRVVLLMIAKA